MKLTKHFLVIFTLLSIFSCSSDDASNSITDGTGNPPTLTTNLPTNIQGTAVTLGGTITNEGGSPVDYRGVCWSLNANPTISDASEFADGSGLGTFSVNINGLEPNTTYHVRAFASNTNSNTVYGNNITFTTGDILNFNSSIPKNINTTRVDLNTTIEESPGVTVGSRGFVLDTANNPTVDDIQITAGYGDGEYGGQVSNLTPNTTYYVRPFALVNGNYVYGAQQSFKTTGYFGPAGGYVVFDKGELSEGWRYLEASPEQASFSNVWGCYNTFISNTFEDVGTGLNNTTQIVTNCSNNSFAAKTAYNYSYNGYSDWFLPSRLEAIIAMRSLSDLNALQNTRHWTSTEVNSSNAYTIYLNNDTIISSSTQKNFNHAYLPLRRY